LTGFFILSDALNTTVTVIATLQNTVVSYNTLTLTYLLIVGIAAQLVGIFSFWTVQKRFKLSTKVMFDVVMLGIVLLDGWGMIGIWTQKFGFHHEWEFWVYQVYVSPPPPALSHFSRKTDKEKKCADDMTV
jgi:MFS-type transporter involved in bile tolerance (Atg22 family)